jgi:hypothetical protein
MVKGPHKLKEEQAVLPAGKQAGWELGVQVSMMIRGAEEADTMGGGVLPLMAMAAAGLPTSAVCQEAPPLPA